MNTNPTTTPGYFGQSGPDPSQAPVDPGYYGLGTSTHDPGDWGQGGVQGNTPGYFGLGGTDPTDQGFFGLGNR